MSWRLQDPSSAHLLPAALMGPSSQHSGQAERPYRSGPLKCSRVSPMPPLSLHLLSRPPQALSRGRDRPRGSWEAGAELHPCAERSICAFKQVPKGSCRVCSEPHRAGFWIVRVGVEGRLRSSDGGVGRLSEDANCLVSMPQRTCKGPFLPINSLRRKVKRKHFQNVQ